MLQLQSNVKTMSSREIAELTGKQHKNVMPVCKSLVDQGVLKSSIPNIYVNDQNGQRYPEFLLDQRDSLILVARLSPEFTATIVDRWQELEQAQAPAIPQTYAAALLEAGRLAGIVEEQSAQIAIAAPKVEYHDNVLASTNGMTITEIGSQVGMSAVKLNRLLADLRVIRRVGGRIVLTTPHLGKGLSTEQTFLDDGGNSRHSMKWTEKGRKFILDLVNS